MTQVTNLVPPYGEFSVRLCEILGLDPDLVCGLTLTITVSDVVTVTATQVLTMEQGGEIIEHMKRYSYQITSEEDLE